MKLIRILAAAALSGLMVAVTAAGTASGAPASDVSASGDTSDGESVGVYCGYHRYGSFHWNDYADDDHGDDIDNVTVYDHPGDGKELRVVVTNSTTGRVESGTANGGERLSINVGNVSNGDHVSVTAAPWNNGAPACSPFTYAVFYE